MFAADSAKLDMQEFIELESSKSMLKFITCGSVDDGKSTLIAQWLVECGHAAAWVSLDENDDEMAFYRDNLLPTWMEEGTGEESFNEQGLRDLWPDKPADQLEKTIDIMTEPGAMTAALNWYRANDGHQSVLDDYASDWEVSNPTVRVSSRAYVPSLMVIV